LTSPTTNNPDPRAVFDPSAPEFAHPSEKEFAQILDFYGLRWEYEPKSFPLRWVDGKIAEALTPDFYLADLDLYVELTTLKQSLVTEKNRKIRRMHEVHPEINVKLLYRRDFHRILAKWGFGPLATAGARGVEKIQLTAKQIEQRVAELGRQISSDYQAREPVLVGVQRGMVCFMADLMREIALPVGVDFMSISHYASDAAAVRVTKDLDMDISGRDVLLVEDIVDTGMTLGYLTDHLREKGPATVEVVTLLDKRVRRLVETDIKYIGFEVPDEFLVGYGLDFNERYRNLPFIGILREE
jgi:hypoxanthine phosphoribosyltransferase